VNFKRPAWSGPILVAADQAGAEGIGVRLAELRRVVRRLAPVARRSHDAAPLYRVVELLSVLDPMRAEAVRISCLPPGKATEARKRKGREAS
jgi:hypothetical protein